MIGDYPINLEEREMNYLTSIILNNGFTRIAREFAVSYSGTQYISWCGEDTCNGKWTDFDVANRIRILYDIYLKETPDHNPDTLTLVSKPGKFTEDVVFILDKRKQTIKRYRLKDTDY